MQEFALDTSGAVMEDENLMSMKERRVEGACAPKKTGLGQTEGTRLGRTVIWHAQRARWEQGALIDVSTAVQKRKKEDTIC